MKELFSERNSDARIITLYKSKGEEGDCINYTKTSLFNVTRNAFAKVVQSRIQTLA